MKCKLGFHKWKYLGQNKEIPLFGSLYYCVRCYKGEQRLIEGTIQYSPEQVKYRMSAMGSR